MAKQSDRVSWSGPSTTFLNRHFTDSEPIWLPPALLQSSDASCNAGNPGLDELPAEDVAPMPADPLAFGDDWL